MNTTPVTGTPVPAPAAAGVLVSPAWLQARLHDPAVRVVEVDVSRAAYNDWHPQGPSWIPPACARSSQPPASTVTAN